MKYWKYSVLAFLLAALLGCADEPDKTGEKESKAESPVQQETQIQDRSAQIAENLANQVESGQAQEKKEKNKPLPLTPEEARLADRTIAFANQAREILRDGTYAAEAILNDNAQRYRDTWRLGKRPKLPGRHERDPRLHVPAGIFDREEEKELTASLDNMDKALNAIIGHYRSLEKYVADSSIVDDGRQGLELSDKLAKNHEQFMAAKKSWLSMVEAKAEEAEAKLLREHPLQRQILAAKNIFAQMNEIGDLIIAEPDNRMPVITLRQNLDNIAAEAAKPPFQASPALERPFRDFLKRVNDYSQILQRALLEGFHNVQRRELNQAMLKSHEAYNGFVRAANALSDSRQHTGKK